MKWSRIKTSDRTNPCRRSGHPYHRGSKMIIKMSTQNKHKKSLNWKIWDYISSIHPVEPKISAFCANSFCEICIFCDQKSFITWSIKVKLKSQHDLEIFVTKNSHFFEIYCLADPLTLICSTLSTLVLLL